MRLPLVVLTSLLLLPFIALAQTGAAPPMFDPNWFSAAFTDAHGRHWLSLVVLGLTVMGWAIRRFASATSWAHTARGGLAITVFLAAIDAAVKALASGLDWNVLCSAVGAAVFISLGLSSPNPQGAVNAQRKAAALRALTLFLLAGSFLLPAHASAAQPLYTVTAGPKLTFKLSATNGNWNISSLNYGGTAGPALAVNFVPNAQGTRFVSVWFSSEFGGGSVGASSEPGTAQGVFAWDLDAGIGTLNDAITFGVSIPAASGSKTSPWQGLVIGKLTKSDVAFVFGLNITFDEESGTIAVGSPMKAVGGKVSTPNTAIPPCSQRFFCFTLPSTRPNS